MKHLKLFETHKKTSKVKELLDGISPEFWKMVTISKWGLALKKYDGVAPNAINREIIDSAAARIYIKYEYSELKKFHDEIDILYDRLYIYFESYWLGDVAGFKYGYDVSNDGYWDLLTSIIGKGKAWTIKCIKDPKLPEVMAKTNNYIENFSYLLNPSLEEYKKIRIKYDPFYREVDKFNL
jgi:hypothetical protein